MHTDAGAIFGTARRNKPAIAALIALLFLLTLLSAGTACAHDPRFACSPRSPDNPVYIRDISKSWAFYGSLAPGQRDFYVFATKRPTLVPMSILVDARDAANPARPVLIVYDHRRRFVAQSNFARAVAFYEPFSRVRYVSSREQHISFGPGTYTAVVSMKGGKRAQRYAFAIGRDERFSVLEIPRVLWAIYRINHRHF